MKGLPVYFIGLVALIHIYILWLEMFVWTSVARKRFRSLPAELFEKTKKMAANQGLYNGFLAAGLVWSLRIKDEDWSEQVAIFFLTCVAIAGLYGCLTVQRSLFFVQTVPAVLALLVLFLN